MPLPYQIVDVWLLQDIIILDQVEEGGKKKARKAQKFQKAIVRYPGSHWFWTLHGKGSSYFNDMWRMEINWRYSWPILQDILKNIIWMLFYDAIHPLEVGMSLDDIKKKKAQRPELRRGTHTTLREWTMRWSIGVEFGGSGSRKKQQTWGPFSEVRTYAHTTHMTIICVYTLTCLSCLFYFDVSDIASLFIHVGQYSVAPLSIRIYVCSSMSKCQND